MSNERTLLQFNIRIRPELIEQIKTAACARRQTATEWCVELFEAALGEDDHCLSLADRVQRLEEAIFGSQSKDPLAHSTENHSD